MEFRWRNQDPGWRPLARSCESIRFVRRKSSINSLADMCIEVLEAQRQLVFSEVEKLVDREIDYVAQQKCDNKECKYVHTCLSTLIRELSRLNLFPRFKRETLTLPDLFDSIGCFNMDWPTKSDSCSDGCAHDISERYEDHGSLWAQLWNKGQSLEQSINHSCLRCVQEGIFEVSCDCPHLTEDNLEAIS